MKSFRTGFFLEGIFSISKKYRNSQYESVALLFTLIATFSHFAETDFEKIEGLRSFPVRKGLADRESSFYCTISIKFCGSLIETSMSNNYLLQRLHQIEQLARAGRWERFSYQPLTYASTLLWRNLIYRFQQRAKLRKTSTFFGTEMKVLLPAGMDIFLLDAKTHDSEIRLSRWLIQNLSVGDTFVDVGAHFGFFSLLASYLVQSSGQVIAFEAAISTFKILQDNVRNHSNIIAHHLAVSDQLGKLIFYEFPVLYSEYNTLKPEQFKDRKWVRSAKQIEVKSITLDQFLDTHKYFPNCIKIDVEGAEEKVLRGFESYLRVHQIKILVEATLLNIARQHSIQHYLESLGYSLFIIQSDGKLRSIQSIEDHLYIKNITSDNFVFQKV